MVKKSLIIRHIHTTLARFPIHNDERRLTDKLNNAIYVNLRSLKNKIIIPSCSSNDIIEKIDAFWNGSHQIKKTKQYETHVNTS